MNRYAWPLLGFCVLLGLLTVGLGLNPREIPSPLVGQRAPSFHLPTLEAGATDFSPDKMLGQVWLLNVWASWCVSCRQEHPVWVEWAKTQSIPLVGLNYKELRGDVEFDSASIAPQEEETQARQRARQWLAQHGNPYRLSVLDLDGRVGINYGVYGVPETYLIDAQGIIRFKQIGPVTPEVLEQKILPLIGKLSP